MKTLEFLLSIVFLASVFLYSNLPGVIIEDVEPSVAQFKVEKGDGDPGYNGDLNFDIPLVSVPSRGQLKFDLKLQYIFGNGVPASQSASICGLGWNFNLPQITCTPAQYFDSFDNQKAWHDGNDFYYLVFPGGSTPIYYFDSITTGQKWQPLKWNGHLKIDAQFVTDINFQLGPTETTIIHKDVDKFIVKDIDGTEYIFSHSLRMQSTSRLTNHCNTTGGYCSDHDILDHLHPYRYVFKLTEIRGTDYKDSNNNNEADISDQGSWIKFNYSNPEILELRIEPSSPKRIHQEVSYLQSIVSPIFEVNFVYEAGYTRKFINNNLQSQLCDLKTLEKISLSDGREIIFDTERAFSWVKGDIHCAYTLVKQEENYDYLRLRLNSIQTVNPAGGQIPKISFQYHAEPPEAHNNNNVSVDSWGFYRNTSSGLQPTPDYWMLWKVNYPTGEIVEYNFESDRYQYPAPMEDIAAPIIAGGLRLTEKIVTEHLNGPGSTYTYEYAQSNELYPGYGFISANPVDNGCDFGEEGAQITQIRFSNDILLDTDVHYPDIEIILPNGGMIKKYYTCAFTGSKGDANSPIEERYHWYSKCYSGVEVEPDDALDDIYSVQKTLIDNMMYCSGPEYFWHFQNSYSYGLCTPTNCGALPEDRNTENAFYGEASEFDDLNYAYIHDPQIGLCYYFQLIDNSWKRGYITREEFFENNDYENPVQENIYHYKMTSLKSESYNYQVGMGNTQFPCLITSGWVKQIKTETVRDEVTQVTEYKDWDEDNGKARKIGEKLPAPPGSDDDFYYKVTETVFAHNISHYDDALLEGNMLNLVAKTIIGDCLENYWQASGDVGCLSHPQFCTLTTYKNWTNGGWAAVKNYQWLDDNNNGTIPSFNFESWSDTGEPDPQSEAGKEWRKVSKVITKDEHGNNQEVEDANTVKTSTFYGHKGSLPLGSFVNAEKDKIFIADFQENDDTGWDNSFGIWNCQNGVYSQTDDEETDIWVYPRVYTDFNVGDSVIMEACIRFDNSGEYRYAGIAKYINIQNYVRFELRKEESKVKIHAKRNGSDSSSETPMSFEENRWYHLRAEIQDGLARLYLDSELLVTVNSLSVEIGSGKIGLCTYGTEASFDDIRIYPSDAQCISQSFDPLTLNVVSNTLPTGITTFYEYDNLSRLQRIRNNERQTSQYVEYTYSRQTNPNDVFNPDNPNRILTRNYYTESLYREGTNFFDGLGRLIQNQIDEGANLIVSETIYDALGREAVVTLPARYFNTNIGFQPGFVAANWDFNNAMTSSSYVSDYYDLTSPIRETGAPDCGNYPFTRKTYFPDPLNRIDKIGNPGSDFRVGNSNNSEITYTYLSNSSNDTVGSTTYPANTLFKTITKDENGIFSESYVDKLGNTVLKINDPSGLNLKTGFKYDILGNLTRTLPPNSNNSESNPFCTVMNYNTLSQLVSKTSPDAGTVKYKYDNNGNLRFVQDQRHDDLGDDLLFYQYDSFNRNTIIGEASADATIPNWDALDGNITYDGIENGNATENFEDLTAHLSDNLKIVYAYDQEPAYGTGVWTNAVDPGNLTNLYGQLAAVAYKDLNSSNWGYTYYSYDKEGRIQKIIQDLPGTELGIKSIVYEYNLQNQITKITYQNDYWDAFFIWYDYDGAGRLQYIYASPTNSKPTTTVASYVYWPTGQVKRLVLGNNIQGVDYVYNPRSWLTQINDHNLIAANDPGHDGTGGTGVPVNDRFAEVVGYQIQTHIASDSDFSANFDAQYNGNISWLITSTGTANPFLTGYTFNYDNTYRLNKADFGYYNSGWIQEVSNGYDERDITYDGDGNFNVLKRYNAVGTSTILNYRYYDNTNKLKNTIGSTSTNNYTYDTSGNLMTDVSKGITEIKYDHRNLPYYINLQVSGVNQKFKHIYDAGGNRVCKTTTN